MKLGVQFVKKTVLNIEHFNCIVFEIYDFF